MPSQHSWTQAAPRKPKRKASAGCSPSSTPMDADLQQRTSRGPKLRDNGTSYMLSLAETRPPRPIPETGYGSSTATRSSIAPSSDIHAIAPTSLGPAPPPAPTQRGLLSAVVQPYAISLPTETPRVHPAQPSPAIDTPTRNHTTPASERTHIVWMFIGNTPSITRTSPTPPPALHPPRRGSRFSSSLPHRQSPLGTLARERPSRNPRVTDNDVESERGNGGHSDSEEDDNDDWIPGLTAGRSEVSPSSAIANQTGPTGIAQDSPQDDAMLNLQVRGNRTEGEPAGNLSPAPIAAPSTPVGNSSHRRTLEDYDQTNARIRALNAGLLSDTRVQWQPRSHPSLSQLRPSASRSLSDRGVGPGVRYLNVPGAATDALMATVRRRASRRHASAAGTGIVDISDSESSQFESDDDNDDGESESSSPLGTEVEAFEVETQTVAEARSTSDPPALPREPPEPATTLAPELEDRVSVASPWRADTASTPQADDARAVDRRSRLQPAHLPALLMTDAPTGSTHLSPPDPKGKKRARDPDVDGGSWLDSARIEGVVREGKRRKVVRGASFKLSVTPLPSRPTSAPDTACRNRLDGSGARLHD